MTSVNFPSSHSTTARPSTILTRTASAPSLCNVIDESAISPTVTVKPPNRPSLLPPTLSTVSRGCRDTLAAMMVARPAHTPKNIVIQIDISSSLKGTMIALLGLDRYPKALPNGLVGDRGHPLQDQDHRRDPVPGPHRCPAVRPKMPLQPSRLLRYTYPRLLPMLPGSFSRLSVLFLHCRSALRAYPGDRRHSEFRFPRAAQHGPRRVLRRVRKLIRRG